MEDKVLRELMELRATLQTQAARLDALVLQMAGVQLPRTEGTAPPVVLPDTGERSRVRSASTGSHAPAGERPAPSPNPNGPRAAAAQGSTPKSRQQSYSQLIHAVRAAVSQVVPPGATVLVASKGDSELLKLEGRRGWHFPRSAGGGYAGHHPADSAQAVAHLEELRARGGDFLLFPSTAHWWLDHYSEFKTYLQKEHRLVFREDEVCTIFALSPQRAQRPLPQRETVRAAAGEHSTMLRNRHLVRNIKRVVGNLLPADSIVAVVSLGDDALLRLERQTAWHFPQTADGAFAPDMVMESTVTIEHLESLRSRGAAFLLLPATALDWIDQQAEFREYLQTRFRRVIHQRYTCSIFDLRQPRVSSGSWPAPREIASSELSLA